MIYNGLEIFLIMKSFFWELSISLRCSILWNTLEVFLRRWFKVTFSYYISWDSELFHSLRGYLIMGTMRLSRELHTLSREHLILLHQWVVINCWLVDMYSLTISWKDYSGTQDTIQISFTLDWFSSLALTISSLDPSAPV